MRKTTKQCRNCNKDFIVAIKELNRTDKPSGLFCTKSCCNAYNNARREQKEKICKLCGSKYTSSSSHSKYCSKSCKQKDYRLKQKSNNVYDRQLLDTLGEYSCEICQWDEAPRDVHHITPVSQGGKNEINNLITLCPNHHRMVHRNLFSQDYLLQIVKSRTISSSLKLVLTKIKEQDAKSGN